MHNFSMVVFEGFWSGRILLIKIALFSPYFVLPLSWCRCAILTCLPGMPDVSARSLGLRRTWMATPLLVATGCLPNELFQTWAMHSVVAQSHAGTSLMLSLHESFGYTFGKMTSYSMGITWAVWVICLAPGWILRLSNGICYRVWPQVLYVF